MTARIDDQRRLILPEEVLKELGWQPGDQLAVNVSGDSLVVQPASDATRLKDEARRLADQMRGFASGAAEKAKETVNRWTSAAAETPSPQDQTPVSKSETIASAARLRTPNSQHPTPNSPLPPITGPFDGVEPMIGRGAYLAPGCTVVGDVVVGEDVSIWPGAAMRGDVAEIRIGARSNVQDGAVLHVSPQLPCVLGEGVTVGHQACVHACVIGAHSLIGIHAVVLDGAKIGSHCIIAAGAVVSPGTEIPDGKMVMGVPGKVVRDLTPQEIERVHWNADTYVQLKNQYLNPPPAQEQLAIPEPPPKVAPPAAGVLPRYECRRTSGAITADGALDDPGWAGIAPMSPLVHSNGTGLPVEATEVRACWDDRGLYIAFACKDADIWAKYENRDDPLYEEEVVEVFLSPTANLAHYYEFELSPANVLFDAKVFSPEGDRRSMLVDKEWNSAGIATGVRVAGILNDRASPDIGWIAELAIPFADLGLEEPPAPGTVWRANFYRIERGVATEFTAWSPNGKEPADFHVPAAFGELVFVA
jgi:carbonic anhydrase/acetyltransferase-like protein (isoleucine patch superfamily)/bifunctional DNA-binding transcriptional regulator/antitoxin component of YhaV-PrlF toxin-antitoxin module